MNSSEEINELAAALSKAQASFPAIPKSDINPFFNKKYAGLPDVVKVASPILAEEGLAVAQLIGYEDDHDTLTTILMHTSGQWISDTMRMRPVKADPQSQGSATTYARRYAYMSALGLVADEDDDGMAAAQPQQSRRNEPPLDVDTETGEVRMIDRGQLIELKTLESKLGKGGKDETEDQRQERMAFYNWASGEVVSSARQLTQRAADMVIAELRKRVPPETDWTPETTQD